MFELFFKYPFEAFTRGDVVFLGRWPLWILAALLLAGAAAFAWPMLKRRSFDFRPVVVWLLQTATLAMLLLMLWQPALSVATLRTQQNIVAIIADDSRSMAAKDDGVVRKDAMLKTLDQLKGLDGKFQVRLYRAGAGLDRIESAKQQATKDRRLEEALRLLTAGKELGLK